MARAHVMRPVIGENGDLLYGAKVTVRESGMSVPIAQTLYAGPTGPDTLINPHLAQNGVIDFWLEEPQRVSVLVEAQGHSDILVYLDAAPPPLETTRTESPLLITGEQTEGNVLLAGDTPGQAVWGPPPLNSGVTPKVEVLYEDFTAGTDPAGWTLIQAATTTHDYVLLAPDGQGLDHSLHAVHTGAAGSLQVRTSSFTLQEDGFVGVWVRPLLAAGEKVVLSLTKQDGTVIPLETIDGEREWGYYRYPAAAGTYQHLSIDFLGAQTFDPDAAGHEMWVTEISAVYGGQVPAHSHPGDGAGSVLLGDGATATGIGSVALGSAASATVDNGLAVGANAASSGANSTAVGSSAQAVATDTVAVGAFATGTLAATGWTVVGKDAYADAADATAVGRGAQALAESGTAIGATAYVADSATNGVAVGQNAKAQAVASLALGSNTDVAATHGNSVAIGYQAATTRAAQIMLGDPNDTYRAVIVGGKLYAVSGVNFGSHPDSRLGFYGSEGTVQPVVTGSDGGVIALRNLISALAGLGLISDSTTA